VGSKYEDQIDCFWYRRSINFGHVYVNMSWHKLLTIGFLFFLSFDQFCNILCVTFEPIFS